MKWKWHARVEVWPLVNVKLKWLCFPSSHITEQNLIWYVEKLQWKFIPVPMPIFPFPYFYFHSHSYFNDIVTVTPIPVGIPWDPNCSHSHAHLYPGCCSSNPLSKTFWSPNGRKWWLFLSTKGRADDIILSRPRLPRGDLVWWGVCDNRVYTL